MTTEPCCNETEKTDCCKEETSAPACKETVCPDPIPCTESKPVTNTCCETTTACTETKEPCTK